MDDLTRQSLEKGYAKQVAQLYQVYFSSAVDANKDPALQLAAWQRFKTGIDLAKKTLQECIADGSGS